MRKYSGAEIKEMISRGYSLESIAVRYNVSKQRMYQVLQSLGIPTLERTKKSFKATWGEKEHWAWKAITNRIAGASKPTKWELFSSLELPDVCPALGIPLDYGPKGVRNDTSPSLDRLIPTLGYVPGNVVVLSWRANRIKNDGSMEEVKRIYEYLKITLGKV